MFSKIIASLVGAAMMVTSAAAQDYLGDDYLPPDAVPMRRMRPEVVPMERVQPDVPMGRIEGSCQHAVQQALQITGGELLSVRPARNGRPICAVTVLVIGPKGRPRKVRVRVPMDF
jgi:hypothetical protein